MTSPNQPRANTADPPSTERPVPATLPVQAGRTPPGLAAVILAAGQGTRMRSGRHKVLHSLAGLPIIVRVLQLVRQAGSEPPVVVLGHLAQQVQAVLPGDVRTVIQAEQLGTGHAVLVAAEALRASDAARLLVYYGDVALVRPESLHGLLDQPVSPEAPLALLTARVPNPRGYGRVKRTPEGTVDRLVEEIEANPEDRAIDEIFSGVMVVWSTWLWPRLDQLPRRANGEYFLTDLVEAARREGRAVFASSTQDAEEVHGVNDRAQLAEANAILWRRKRETLMREGVTLFDPATTYVEPEVRIEPDVVLHPGCHLRGTTHIASGCTIGPDAEIVDSQIGANSRVWRSVIEGSVVGQNVSIGPFSHLRPGAELADGVVLGNYAEVKGSRLGRGTQMHHFSYIGDAELGERVNIGAGTITANFDGQRKHRTTIGNDVKTGSGTVFRAPVEVGDGAVTGAGSVVTHDVAAGAVVAGVPARPLRPMAEQRQTEEDTLAGH